MGALTFIARAGGDDWVWDYSCECGSRYRVAADEGGARFWPAIDGSRFSATSVRAGSRCVKCAEPLTLNGHATQVPGGFVTESLETIHAHPVRGVEREGDTTYVALQGEIDLYNAAELRSVLTRECARRPKRLVVDLSAVDFLDSTALHALQSARKELADRRGFSLLDPTPAIQRALEHSGLDRVLTVQRSRSPEPSDRLVA